MNSKPKPKHFTPLQEQQIMEADMLSTRAEIFELGCTELLKRGPMNHEVGAVRDVLDESIRLRNRARDLRAKAESRPKVSAQKGNA
jgi:hypothetical protein